MLVLQKYSDVCTSEYFCNTNNANLPSFKKKTYYAKKNKKLN